MSSLWPEELFKLMEGHSKVIRQFERLKRVDNKVLEQTITTVSYSLTHCFTRICKKITWISHQPKLYLPQLNPTKLSFFETPCTNVQQDRLILLENSANLQVPIIPCLIIYRRFQVLNFPGGGNDCYQTVPVVSI